MKSSEVLTSIKWRLIR